MFDGHEKKGVTKMLCLCFSMVQGWGVENAKIVHKRRKVLVKFHTKKIHYFIVFFKVSLSCGLVRLVIVMVHNEIGKLV
jgi:hypothetical protein